MPVSDSSYRARQARLGRRLMSTPNQAGSAIRAANSAGTKSARSGRDSK